MNKRSFRTAKVSRLLRTAARKRNLLVQDRAILRRKRSELAEVAFDLFVDRGYHRTGVREIAAAAGLSVGAVFTYFTDKEEILAHIFFEQLERHEKELLGTLRALIGEGTKAGADPETVFDTVFARFMIAVDTLHRFIALAYQESKSLNAAARKELMVREKRVQALLAEAIRYGAERGRFATDHIELKAHNIMVLGHAWAIRHWMFAGVMDSVDDYREFLRPLLYSMLETGPVSGWSRTDQSKTTVEGKANRSNKAGILLKATVARPSSIIQGVGR
jgi:TetR/AcrR family transcriptional regulator, cholesterol catabolism regulator